MQHDFFHYQSGAVGLHDFPSAFYGAGVSEFSWPSPTTDAEDQEESVSDCGWSPSTQVTISEHVGWTEHGEQIRIFCLPSYSPELNPDELLNQDVKTNALGRVRPVNVTGNDGQRSLLPSDHAGEAHGGEELFS